MYKNGIDFNKMPANENDHGDSIRTQLINERENAEIMSKYEKAFNNGLARWFSQGGGSLFQALTGTMEEAGLIPKRYV
jgi:hypothetical protein